MRVLALDYGSARCGCALSDPSGTIVTPIAAVAASRQQAGDRRDRATDRGSRSRTGRRRTADLAARVRYRADARDTRVRQAPGRTPWRRDPGRAPRRAVHDTHRPPRAARPAASGVPFGRARTRAPPLTCSRAGCSPARDRPDFVAEHPSQDLGRSDAERQRQRAERARRRSAAEAQAPRGGGEPAACTSRARSLWWRCSASPRRSGSRSRGSAPLRATRARWRSRSWCACWSQRARPAGRSPNERARPGSRAAI